MAARVAIDNVPALARPPEVERADVESAAAAARAGQPVTAEGKAVEKARNALLAAQRALNVVRLAQQGAEEDVAREITEHAADWSVELAGEIERAREAARASLAAFEDATRRLVAGAAAENWVAASVDVGRFDRPTRGVVAASNAPSSARTTANGAPLTSAEILGFAAELIDPPTSMQTSAPSLAQA